MVLAENNNLTGLLSLPLRSVDHALISAFVERWHPETNTFHMPWGEMTITLHDVRRLVGLSIDGDGLDITAEPAELIQLGCQLTGRTPV